MKITTLVPCPQCGAMLARNLVERIEDFGDYGFKCTASVERRRKWKSEKFMRNAEFNVTNDRMLTFGEILDMPSVDQENLIWVGHWEYDDVDNAIFEEQAREIEPA